MSRSSFSRGLCALLLLAASARGATADEPDTASTPPPVGPPGGQLSAVRRVHESGPRRAPLTVAVGSGYGYTESVLGLQDQHHRLLGTLLLEGAPLRWLGLGLRLDGRYDRHRFDGRPSDDGWVGEPRLFARADRALGPDTSVGARLGLFLPGAEAPSWRPEATSADLQALVTHRLGAVAVTGNLGYRLDQSADSVLDADAYQPGDRLALGVSAFDAVLLGASARTQAGRWQLFGEWSWEALVGGGAPAASQWPMRLGAGARTALTSSVELEVEVEGSPSGRPRLMEENAPLVPVPARLGFMAALVVPLGVAPAPPPRPVVVTPPPPAPVPEVVVALETEGRLPEGAAVVLRRPGGGDPGVAFEADGAGRYRLREQPPGPAEVVVTAPGYEESRTPVLLASGQPLTLDVALKRLLPSGQIRGTVRSFDGRPLAATVRVVRAGRAASGPGEPETEPEPDLRSTGGRFQLDVPPGRYQVLIEAPGHTPQTRAVEVEQNGVTVLNVDLRRAR